MKNVSAARGAIDVPMVRVVPLVRLGSLVIYLPNVVGANVDPLGLVEGERGPRVLPEKFPPPLLVVMGADANAAAAIAGTVGADKFGPTVPTTGKTPVIGTAGAEPTPRLLISVEPIGIPVRAKPPGVIGNVDVDVGADDEAMLLDPEPHIPDIPDVSIIPEDVDVPDATDISDDVDVPGIAMGSVEAAVGGVSVAPDVVAVAGDAVPGAVPPPSKLAADPNIADGDSPAVEHVVPLLVIAPLVGIPIVPVTLPVGAGLTPADVISVESTGADSKRRGGAERRHGREGIVDLNLGERGTGTQQGPGRYGDQQWSHGGHPHKSGRFGDHIAWHEAIRHRSIPGFGFNVGA
jgi:hypothetical protein